MAADREHPAISDRQVTHHLVEEAPRLAPQPARWTWPRIGPAVFALLWVLAMAIGRQIFEWGLAEPARQVVVVSSTLAVFGLIALAGRVRPTPPGGE